MGTIPPVCPPHVDVRCKACLVRSHHRQTQQRSTPTVYTSDAQQSRYVTPATRIIPVVGYFTTRIIFPFATEVPS